MTKVDFFVDIYFDPFEIFDVDHNKIFRQVIDRLHSTDYADLINALEDLEGTEALEEDFCDKVFSVWAGMSYKELENYIFVDETDLDFNVNETYSVDLKWLVYNVSASIDLDVLRDLINSVNWCAKEE